VITEGFVILKGSHISLVDDDTITAVIKEQRKKAPVDENGILQEDMLFSSPFYAAMFVYWEECKWADKPQKWA
jgi:hypothetical protein